MASDDLYDEAHPGLVLADKYRLEKLLGRGGMGSVWRCQHLTLDSKVAVKILHPAGFARKNTRARFLREAKAAAMLRSAHVVQIMDQGTDGPFAYIVMELLEGVSLADLLEEGKAEGSPNGTSWVARKLGLQAIGEQSYLRLVVRWCIELAGGLSAAHSKGIFPRDVKPSNVLVAHDQRKAGCG